MAVGRRWGRLDQQRDARALHGGSVNTQASVWEPRGEGCCVGGRGTRTRRERSEAACWSMPSCGTESCLQVFLIPITGEGGPGGNGRDLMAF